MATRYVFVLVTLVGLSTACAVIAESGNAREHVPSATSPASRQMPDVAELIEWHSGSALAGMKSTPRRKSSLEQRDTEDSAPLLRMHGAPGFQNLAQDRQRHTSGYAHIPIDFRGYAKRPVAHER